MTAPGEPRIVLASGSPRRRELLLQLGVAHRRVSVGIPEHPAVGESPADYVQRVALDKARAAARAIAGPDVRVGAELPASKPRQGPALPVLGADTAVVLDGTILGKPRDDADALRLIDALQGHTHQVFTGVALIGSREHLALSCSQVSWRPLTRAERQAYVATGEGRDKAGGYAVQGLAAQYIQHIEGSYSGIMGLPLFETAALLRTEGVIVTGSA